MAHFVNFLKSKGFVAGRHAYKPMLIFVLLYAFHSLSLSLPLFFLSQIKITQTLKMQGIALLLSVLLCATSHSAFSVKDGKLQNYGFNIVICNNIFFLI